MKVNKLNVAITTLELPCKITGDKHALTIKLGNQFIVVTAEGDSAHGFELSYDVSKMMFDQSEEPKT